ncbi:MAG TPA: D-alanyl-D-alanine carboxypeptidase/D-alanyl-D-alanine-endopeptidase [Gemmataceae bacterium]|nr:D-alanyl-D-alanine carboxypeptidase/D-alanyl-D-alanine-endopeptidase [Gemmataceae bacterium]
MCSTLRVSLVWVVPVVAAGLLVSAPEPAPARGPDGLAKLIDEVIDGPDYKHASWGVLVVDAKTGKTVYARNPDAMLAPASVTKLFSCAAALVAVGPDQKFETVVFRRGPVQDSTLRGDLILVASGDLTLGGRTDKDGHTVFKNNDHTYASNGATEAELTDTDPLAGLDALAKQVKDAGITRIDGDVLIDDRLFARAHSSGSGPDAVTPIVVNDNVVDVIIQPGTKPGDPAKVTTRPESAFYHVDALVSTTEAGSMPFVQVVATGPSQFAVRGEVPVGKPIVRICPTNEPALFARALFIEALRRHGVRAGAPLARPVETSLPPRDWYADAPKVASFTSPPFKDVIKVTLKVSHNLYASSLPCLVAVARGQSTIEAGLREERKILRRLDVDVSAVSFGGGAGGAPADHVSPRAVIQLLSGMAKRPEWAAFKDGLPVLGVDGTLASVVKEDSPARGKVFAKTGTLTWYDAVNGRSFLRSKALGGVMTTKSGATLYFAMIVNNVPLPLGVTATREGTVLGRLCEILYENGP